MLARLIKGNNEAAIESMFCEHERDGALWKIEWKAANEVVILAGSSSAKAKNVIANLKVDTKKMRANLDILKGLMQSEGIMLELGKKIGKQKAHSVVYQVCMDTFEQNEDFCEMLLKNELIAEHMTRVDILKILDPEGYTGFSGQIVDGVVANIKAARASYTSK